MSMPKRGHCKYFAQGLCYKGEHCAYLHDKRAPSHTLCNFYQKGRCAYGSRCRYEHVKPAVSWHPASTSSTAQSMIKDSVSQDLSSRHNSVEDSPPSVPCRLWHGASSSSAPFPSNVSDPVSSAFVKLNLISESKHNSTLKMPLVSENSDNADIGEYRSGRPMNISLCPLAADGTCSRGENCFDVHGDLCSTCGKYSLHPFIPQEREEHLRACEKNKKHLEALELSQEIECSVCFDRVLSKTAAAERKFGILSECEHSFCITCIRNWRRSSSSGMDSLRACPICRKVSYFVVPSEVWFTTKEEKAQIVDNYKERLKSIDCKHFSFGNGNCPFGSSCFYKHTVKPGSYTWIHNRPPPPLHSRRMTVDSLLDILSIQVIDDEDDVYTHVDLMDPSDYGMDENDPFSMDVLLHQLVFDSSEEDDD